MLAFWNNVKKLFLTIYLNFMLFVLNVVLTSRDIKLKEIFKMSIHNFC